MPAMIMARFKIDLRSDTYRKVLELQDRRSRAYGHRLLGAQHRLCRAQRLEAVSAG